MKEKNLDRRVVRTRRALQNALIQLILEHGYDNVTIEEITEHANLGRTTFYLHFTDKEDLLMQAIDTICDDFIEEHKAVLSKVDKNENPPIKKLPANFEPGILYHIFSHARDNANFYKVMLRGEGGAKVSRRFASIIQDETIKRLKSVDAHKSKVPEEIFSVMFSGTLITMITWWLENNQPYPIDTMVKYFQQMFLLGALDTLQLSVETSHFDHLNQSF